MTDDPRVKRPAAYKHGLYLERQHVCPCGTAFASRRPSARYCSNTCRVQLGGYGRSYGQYQPRQFWMIR